MSATTTKTKNKGPEVSVDTEQLPATVQQGGALSADYGADVGMGMEDVRPEERLIPFLRILQALSPQCDPRNGLDGAKPGMIYNTATQELIDGEAGFQFVPCFRDRNFVEYVPREAGGGFVSIQDPDDPRIIQMRKDQGSFGKLQLENGNELVETYYFYGLAMPLVPSENGYAAEEPFECVIAFASTQIKKYKMMMERMTRVVGIPAKFPIFAHVWRFGSVGEKNKKGNFEGWRMTLAAPRPEDCRLTPNSDLYQHARSFALSLKEGKARANFAEGLAGTATETEEEIPM